MNTDLFQGLELPPRYEDDFDDLSCILSSFTDGLNYLQGDDSAGHFAVSSKLLELINADMFDEPKIKRLILVFNALKFHYHTSSKFKTEPMLSFSVRPEKNLLAGVLKDGTQSRLNLMLNAIFTADFESLDDKQRLGLLSLLMAIESGVLSKKLQVNLITALSVSKSVSQIEGLFFIDYLYADRSSNHEYTKRVFIGPLVLSLLLRDNWIERLATIVSRVKFSSTYLDSARLRFLTSEVEEGFDTRQISFDLNWFGLIYLPGYLLQVANATQESFSLSLPDFAKLHGIHVGSDSLSDDIDFMEDWNGNNSVQGCLEDEEGAESAGKINKRVINTRYFRRHDFDALIHYLSIHPTVSTAEFKQFRLILCLCFYLGLRRGEALYIRCCDIFSDESESVPATVYVREFDNHTLKTVTSQRHQPLSLLPQDIRDELIAKASFASEELVIGRSFSTNQAIHFFDRLSKLMQECLGKSFVMHTGRHSYVSRGLLQSEFNPLGLHLLTSASSFMREIAEDEQRFRHSFRLNNVTMQHLTNVSQSAGHAKVSTTLRHYCHSTDLLIFGALNSSRPEGYQTAVERYSGIPVRSLQRWKSGDQLYVQTMCTIAKRSEFIKIYDTPLAPLDTEIEQSFSLYKRSNFTGELSSRELWEWARLYKLFNPEKSRALVEFVGERMGARGSFRLANRADLKQLIKLTKGIESMDIAFWEVKQPSTKSNVYLPLNSTTAYVFPIHLRVSYAEDEAAGNAPRRIFPMLISTLREVD